MTGKYRRILRKCATVLLACFIMMSACFAESLKIETRHISFDAMAYDAVNIEILINGVAELTEAVSAADSFECVRALYAEYQSLIGHYQTMAAIAFIRARMDRGDSYWAAEDERLSVSAAAVYRATAELAQAMCATPFWRRLEAEMGMVLFAVQNLDDFLTDETVPLFEREAALAAEYAHRLAIYDGGASAAWYDVYGDEMIERHIELIELRRQIARTLGFSDYPALMFAMYGRNYSPQQCVDLAGKTAEYIVPLLTSLRERYAPPVFPEIEFDAFSASFRTILSSFSGDMAAVFDIMLSNELYDTAERPKKDDRAFTIYLPEYGVPFLFSVFRGTNGDVLNVVHEFGHFYNSYVTGRGEPSVDLAEIHSQGLELLAGCMAAGIYGAAYEGETRAHIIKSITSSITRAAYYTALEFALYEMDPDALSVDVVKRVAWETAYKYHVAIDDEGAADYQWITAPHIVEQPFYMASYMTSGLCVLEMWARSEYDADVWRCYLNIANRSDGGAFLSVIRDAGLHGPFETGGVQATAESVAEKLQ